MPESWRHGHVVTIYKGDGDVHDPSSYRPITITSVIARAYERVNAPELINEMLRHDIPSLDQFGFTRQRSTHDALYRLLSRIHEIIDSGAGDNKFVPAVFVDISKAYDKVWIEGLLYKIHHDLGITGNLYYMLRELLTNRTFQVVADGKMSIRLVLRAGVPQGSILAPFLFLIYIHDIISRGGADPELTQIIASLFADDIAVMPTEAGMAGLSALQRALDHLTRYARKWKITFSAKKTNTVIFRKRRKTTEIRPDIGDLTLGGFSITTTHQYTYLGVILDEFLSFAPHVKDLFARVSRTAYMISRLVRRDHHPSIPVIRTLVKNILVPQLTYSLPFIPDKDAVMVPGAKAIAAEKKKRREELLNNHNKNKTRNMNKYKNKNRNNNNNNIINHEMNDDEMERKYDDEKHEQAHDMVTTRDRRREERKQDEKHHQQEQKQKQDEKQQQEEQKQKQKYNDKNKYIKNLILRPLLHRMGLPHSAQHESVFIENRLLNVNSLLSATKAALAHRWLTLGADSENLAASMFHSHLSRFSSLPPSHPCRVIVLSILKVREYEFNTNDTRVFSRLSRSDLRPIAWKQQYRSWRNDLPHTVPLLYVQEPVSMRELPAYMEYDKPRASSRRSRLRFGREKTKAMFHHLKFKDAEPITCTKCSTSSAETVSHVLADCSYYREPRATLMSSLVKLRLSQDALSFIKNESVCRVVLDPSIIPAVSKFNLYKIHRRTAKFINAIHTLRKF